MATTEMGTGGRSASTRSSRAGRGKRGACAGGDGEGCEVGELLQLLGKPYVMGILYIFHTEPGPHRFGDLQRKLEVSPNTLTERLKELVQAGLLTRTSFNEIPPRVDYDATPKAEELIPIFQTILEWAQRHSLKPEPAASVTASAKSASAVAGRT